MMELDKNTVIALESALDNYLNHNKLDGASLANVGYLHDFP